VEVAIIIGVMGGIALVPYYYLLSKRAPAVDAVQLLDRTHAPTLASVPLIIGLIVAIVAFIYARRTSTHVAVLCISFALTPVVLLNQQVLTGISLQPVHYEIFIGNYLVLVALLLLAFMLYEKRLSETARLHVYLLLIAGIWGFLEVATSANRSAASAGLRDRAVPAITRISAKPDAAGKVVLATNFDVADIIPTFGPLRPLWSAHSSSAGGIDPVENKRLFYLFLYFSGFTSRDLADALNRNSFEVTAAIFGSDRALPTLASGGKGISKGDIETEVKGFEAFVARLDRQTALTPEISYAVIPKADDFDMRNIDRWYSRDAGVEVGLFRVYELQPKP
jgi:hypothetical protein